jgi:hypothetical protein
MPKSTPKAKSHKHERLIPKKYIPLVKGLAGEGHAFVDIAAYFGTTSEVIARVVLGNDLAHIPALSLPKLPVLKLADIVDVSKRLDAAIKLLDNGEAVAARGMIVGAAEIVNSPSM